MVQELQVLVAQAAASSAAGAAAGAALGAGAAMAAAEHALAGRVAGGSKIPLLLQPRQPGAAPSPPPQEPFLLRHTMQMQAELKAADAKLHVHRTAAGEADVHETYMQYA